MREQFGSIQTLRVIGLRYPVDVGLVADARRGLGALIPLLHRKNDRSFLQKAQDGMKDWNKTMLACASNMDMANQAAGMRAAKASPMPRKAVRSALSSRTRSSMFAENVLIRAAARG